MDEQLRRRVPQKIGQRERCLFPAEVKLYRAADPIEASAVAFGTWLALVGHIFRGVDAELAQARGWIVVLFVIRLEHPGEHATVTTARRTPTTRRVEREVFR